MGSSIDIIDNIFIAYRAPTAVCIRSSSSNNDLPPIVLAEFAFDGAGAMYRAPTFVCIRTSSSNIDLSPIVSAGFASN